MKKKQKRQINIPEFGILNFKLFFNWKVQRIREAIRTTMKEEEVGNKITEMMMRGMTIITKLEVLFDHF